LNLGKWRGRWDIRIEWWASTNWRFWKRCRFKIKNRNISIETEKVYGENYFIPNYIYLPKTFSIYNHTNISIKDAKNTINPKKLICNNYKYLYKTNLRKYSFIRQFPRVPCSIIMKILKYFINYENNEKSLIKFWKKKIKLIYHIILLIIFEKCLDRQAFAHCIKYEYKFNKLGNRAGTSNTNIDELLFTDINKKIWIIGAKNNKTIKIGLDVFQTRNRNDMKTFIYNHIKFKNYIKWLIYSN